MTITSIWMKIIAAAIRVNRPMARNAEATNSLKNVR